MSKLLTTELCVLATSDVHGQLLGGPKRPSLAGIANVVQDLRGKFPNLLLLDNGDFLQGSPIADIWAEDSDGGKNPNPVIASMNLMNYDAVALGNHEFNLEANQLRAALEQARFPVLCANLHPQETAYDGLWQPCFLKSLDVATEGGDSAQLTIGLFGVAPVEILNWDQSRIRERILAEDMVVAARSTIEALKARGADIVIALAHTGLAASAGAADPENQGLEIAGLPGIDALILGHTHQVFPFQDFEDYPGVDIASGTMRSTPTVMPGRYASHLGQISLKLQQNAAGWVVTGSQSQVLKIESQPDVPAISHTLEPARARVKEKLARPVATLENPINSFFCLASDDLSVRLVAEAQAAHVREHFRNTQLEDVPVLSAAAPLKCGGRSGPGNFSNIPPGEIKQADIIEIVPFPNDISALYLSGAQIEDWLERAAGFYNQILPGQGNQPLRDSQHPAYFCDAVTGLDYCIDLGRPARFAADGALVAPDNHRVQEILYQGKPLKQDQMFLLACPNYRSGGGGHYPHAKPENTVLNEPVRIASILEAHLKRSKGNPAGQAGQWRLCLPKGSSATFDTSPLARGYLPAQGSLPMQEIGLTPEGFLRFRLTPA